jgi:2'-5' RNA ligase
MKIKKNMNFTSFKNWLFENIESRLQYACVMLQGDISPEKWQEYLDIIKKEDVYDNARHEYGYCHEPHITLIYGLKKEELDIDPLFKEIKHIRPITLTINEIGVFENPDFDVVKFNVPVVEALKEYRNTFLQFPNKQDFPEYKPHMTIAYIKPGEGKKYAKKIEPFEVTYKRAIYSFKDTRIFFDLHGNHKF